ncbi:MAG TPA: shikimate kinase, partial [Aggregatilineales bacterium]|nr:shikimate kinase [Aggregatilineales bacterium]
MNKMHMQNPNIVLTGYMGTGKTTIGQLVAEKTGREFIDMDDIIISRIGKSIPEIFAAYGEAFFRGVEAGICVELGEARNLVIATGGGALIRADNLNAISGACNIVICLTADVDTIIARLDADAPGRPMIDRENEDRHTRISNLLKERRSAYQRIRLQLDTSPL